jgi:ubiquinol oxidase
MEINSTANEMFEDTKKVSPHIIEHDENYKYTPKTFGDNVAKIIVHISARCADIVFGKRYGHRAIVLETIAAVPGMVGALFQHLKSLRHIKNDNGWIRELLDEAENERIHLLVYSEIAKPTSFERFLIMFVQFFFFVVYFLLYLISPSTAHRVVGYFEEEAIHSYQTYLRLIDEGAHKNIDATDTAKKYWQLNEDAKLRDMVIATIKDEMLHRDVNHKFSNDKKGASLWN